MTRKTKGFIVVLALALLALPVQMQCGHLLYGCATAPNPGGMYYTYYEVEPLGVTLIETLIGTNLHIYYWSGQEGHSIQK